MAATLQQVTDALRASFPRINVDALEIMREHRIFGIVIDPVFSTLDHPDRQKLIWTALERQLSPMELALVGPIAALSPDEAELRSADVA